ncbi:MAG TPA: hypothetical protein PL009_05610 [Flavipsychrobacter sp.]|nr:hypothetical protein [Flavipsychrobacter sp.]
MKSLLLAMALLPCSVFAQLIRQNEIDENTGKRIVRTETIALTKGFIYNFMSSGKEKYVQVRIQKHGHFTISENDTLVFVFEGNAKLKALAVRGGDGKVPFRPKSPGVLSLWSLFKINDSDFYMLTKNKVVSVYVIPQTPIVGYDKQLVFSHIKTKPAELLNERAKALLDCGE